MIETIQALRGIAAFLVAWDHAFASGGRYGIIPTGVFSFTVKYGMFGVDLFFVISGFIMYYVSRRLLSKEYPRWEFLKRRTIRIIPMYWLATLLMAGLMLIGLFPHLKLHLIHFVCSMLFIPHLEPDCDTRTILFVGWTLCFEMYFYLVFACLMPLAEEILILGSGAFFAATALAAHVLPIPKNEFLTFVMTNSLTLEFWFGIVLGRIFLKGTFRKNTPLAWSALIGGFLLSIAATTTAWTGVNPQTRFLAWGLPAFLIVAGAVHLTPSFKSPAARLMLKVGDASYTLYLIHYFVNLTTWTVCSRLFNVTTSAGAAVVIPLCLVLSVLASLAVYAVVEAPLTHYLHHKFKL